MSGQQNEVAEQHLLLMVETAQRAGQSESEITAIVDDALVADAELKHAA